MDVSKMSKSTEELVKNLQAQNQKFKKQNKEIKNNYLVLSNQKKTAEKQGKASKGWFASLLQGINTDDKIEVKNILQNKITCLPSEIQFRIKNLIHDINELKMDWKKTVLIIFGVALLTTVCYFLLKEGFFGWCLLQLKEFAFPYLKQLLLSVFAVGKWILKGLQSGWKYLFG